MTSSPEEIGELIVALLPRLRRFARSLSRNQHDADDLAQVAVERAVRIVRGHTSADKLVEVAERTSAQVEQRLAAAGEAT